MEPTPPSLLWNDSILCFWSCSAMIRDGSANCTGPLAEKSDFIPYSILFTIGLTLILIGVPLFLVSIKSLHHAYNNNSLITTGIYGFCRHPMYGVWIFLIVPGIALIARSLLGLTTPVVMYIVLRILAKKEETYLEEKFGVPYLQYKRKTPFVLPIGWIKTKS
jgi:protein-S-isoprenylcysteine O-methyltransferase Ste14